MHFCTWCALLHMVFKEELNMFRLSLKKCLFAVLRPTRQNCRDLIFFLTFLKLFFCVGTKSPGAEVFAGRSAICVISGTCIRCYEIVTFVLFRPRIGGAMNSAMESMSDSFTSQKVRKMNAIDF